MNNPETQATLDTRHINKTKPDNKRKTGKKMSNTDPAKNLDAWNKVDKLECKANEGRNYTANMQINVKQQTLNTKHITSQTNERGW